jgi:energy-coupling factor transporter ATP-binding protein EcfA2
MKLEKLIYSQFEGEMREWKLEPIELEEINLLVGRNSSGKTKTLNVIRGLGQLVAGEIQATFKSGKYHAFFNLNGKKLEYLLTYENAKIIKEIFDMDGKRLLERGIGGVGTLWAEREKKDIQFQTPETQLACIARRDSIQHPFFESLFEWGKSVYHYSFGSELGRNQLGIRQKEIPTIDPKDPNHVLRIFRRGQETLGAPFIEAIKNAMTQIGYEIEDVGLMTPVSIVVTFGGQAEPPVGLYVKEKDLNSITDQFDMSQGMFRTLSIIIQIIYAQMAAVPSCIIIDDIGEGLDFERSCALLDLLVKRTTESHVQLIMATNDRFIMNKVPLQAWTVLQRDASNVHVFNYKNSKSVFDEFAVTGLNNFDFFSMDFVKQGKLGK